MSTTDLLGRWSTQSLDEIQEELDAGQNLMAAEQLFGADEVASMRAVEGADGELMRSFGGKREAVVLLPGLMGSLLASVRGVITLLWLNPALILKGQSHLLELNGEGTADASPNVLATAFSLEKLCYLKPALTLNRASTLFEFPYDWRLRIETNADRLSEALERWAGDDADLQFTLVGHSMGGLVSRAFVARHQEQAKRRIKRVIMHGTPHFGAAGAIADLIEGNRMMALASSLNANNAIKRFVLNMPSAYQLLPAPPDLFPKDRHYPANFDVYDARQWRLEGVRQDYLEEGRRFHELLADFDHPVEMIQIAGCHQDTKVDVALGTDSRDRPVLDIITQAKGVDSGDATVPLYSARLPGAEMYYIQEIHRYLPRNDRVIQATIDLIYGRKPSLPAKLPRPKGGLLDRFRAVGDPEEEAERLRQRLAAGVATEQDLEQFYFLDY
jgi:pimeloyl-ACP methyl ester carboxylesterase